MTLDPAWLSECFKAAGLSAEVAEKAAAVALRKLLRRQRARPEPWRDPQFRASMTADPLVSVNRILGLGDAGLPFVDDLHARLAEVDFVQVLAEAGLDALVALGFAKVIVEQESPASFYGPVWRALGKQGPVDLDELRRIDWSSLRGDADRGLPPLDPGPPPPPPKRAPRPIVSPPPKGPAKPAKKATKAAKARTEKPAPAPSGGPRKKKAKKVGVTRAAPAKKKAPPRGR